MEVHLVPLLKSRRQGSGREDSRSEGEREMSVSVSTRETKLWQVCKQSVTCQHYREMKAREGTEAVCLWAWPIYHTHTPVLIHHQRHTLSVRVHLCRSKAAWGYPRIPIDEDREYCVLLNLSSSCSISFSPRNTPIKICILSSSPCQKKQDKIRESGCLHQTGSALCLCTFFLQWKMRCANGAK